MRGGRINEIDKFRKMSSVLRKWNIFSQKRQNMGGTEKSKREKNIKKCGFPEEMTECLLQWL